MKKKNLAIVYDWIDKWGGVERILLQLRRMFPHADFYTSYVSERGASWAREIDFTTSFIQRLPAIVKSSRVFSFPLYPYAFESFDFSDYDTVLSISSSFAKGIITKPGTKHVCYLLSPTRYLWTCPELYLGSLPTRLLAPYIAHIKRWDLIAAMRPDIILTLSEFVSKKIRDFYRRDSQVVYPPFDVSYWDGFRRKKKNTGKAYFLAVSRMEPYKRMDILLETFRRMPDRNLVLVGKGSGLPALKRSASPNITFVQDIPDKDLAAYYEGAEALIMPQSEDFGYVALEAQTLGCPVIAYRESGVAETVEEGKTGLFFDSQTHSSLTHILAQFDRISYNLKHITRELGPEHAKKFSASHFEQKLTKLL